MSAAPRQDGAPVPGDAPSGRKVGVYVCHCGGNISDYVDVERVAAEALGNPDAWRGRKVNLAGDVLTVGQMKRVYREVTERRPQSWPLPATLFRRLAPEFAAQLKWHNEVGFAFGVEDLRRLRPDARTFAGFLTKAGIRNL